MSNYLAIATVTATLKHLLFQEMSNEINDTQFIITSNPPDSGSDKPPTTRLNLFLYNITPNTGYNNIDLPTRNNTTGELIQKQILGLNLYYLLTVYAADNDDIVAHKLLASAIRILNEFSILKPKTITDAVYAENNRLIGSDLADQIESIKLNLHTLSLDEITKLWASFFQTNYRISVSYQATVVILDGLARPSKISPPVQERGIYVIPYKQPIIEKIEPNVVEYDSDQEISIFGQNLKNGENISVKTSKSPDAINLSDKNITDKNIKIKLSQFNSGLNIGVNEIQMVYFYESQTYSQSLFSSSSSFHTLNKKFEHQSNISVFMLVPKITTVLTNDDDDAINPLIENLIFHFIPPLTSIEKQNVSVILDNNTIKIPSENIEVTPTDNIVTIGLPPSLPDKTYFLRVLVNGTISLLRIDNNPENPTFNKSIPIIQLRRGI